MKTSIFPSIAIASDTVSSPIFGTMTQNCKINCEIILFQLTYFL